MRTRHLPLIPLTAAALARDQKLEQFSGRVADSGEGQWTIDAAREACERGSTVLLRGAPGQGHGILDFGAAPAEWLRDRYAGAPAPSSCAEMR